MPLLCQVPDYLDIISQPMDFSTMRKKLESHEYTSVVAFSADFQLIYRNCMTYNAKDTVYFRAAVRLRDSGAPLLRFARKQAEKAGIDPDTGMHSERLRSSTPETLCGILNEGQLLEVLDASRWYSTTLQVASLGLSCSG